MKSYLKPALQAASVYLGRTVTKESLRQSCKRVDVVRQRWFVGAYLRAVHNLGLRGYSYPQISKILSLRDHTSVMHGVRSAHALWGEGLFEELVLRDEALENAWRFENGVGWVRDLEKVAAAMKGGSMTERERDERDLTILDQWCRGETAKAIATRHDVSIAYVRRLIKAWKEAA